ncbi:hypothetical protein BKA70DRAFT_218531 [Coprinopsis sp. MPI-PUGE-AT-0042]|nr:hypothetical protein BKA70DRAFT_218531 [Coprinopsis sp. MPI-PUGE-AT-0042]
MGDSSASTRSGQWLEDGGDVGTGERLRRWRWCGHRRRNAQGRLDFSGFLSFSGSQGRRSTASVRGESRVELASCCIPLTMSFLYDSQNRWYESQSPEGSPLDFHPRIALCISLLEVHKLDTKPSHRSALLDRWSDTFPPSTVKTEQTLVPDGPLLSQSTALVFLALEVSKLLTGNSRRLE